MKRMETSLEGVLIIESPVHADARGFFTETFVERKFGAIGLPTHFAQDNHSRSVQHTLRGLHYQLEQPQGKLVRPVTGSIFDVAVDLRKSSPTFGAWFGTVLTAGDGRQLWVPAGFAHGFLVMSEIADVTYKCTTEYHQASERCLRWDDKTVGITWPLISSASVQLSPKDANGLALDVVETFS